MKSIKPTSDRSIQSLDRAFDILDVLGKASSQGLSLKAICAATGLNPSTAHHLIATMVQRGYVGQDVGTRHYMLGPMILQLRAAAVANIDLQRVALPFAQDLVTRTGEGVYVTLLRGWHLRTVISLPSPHPVRVVRPSGPELELHATASGKCLLAYEPESVIDAYFGEGPLKAFTENTIVDPAQIRAELQQIFIDGFALDREEHALGVSCIAAPVFNDVSAVVASLSIAYPTFRGIVRDKWIDDVQACALGLSAHLGYPVADSAAIIRPSVFSEPELDVVED
jgi:DNA-binding IclR family transcriptional regulator